MGAPPCPQSCFTGRVPKFASYEPSGHGQAAYDLDVRELTRADLPACARLAADRAGRPAASQTAAFARAIDDDRRLVLVADHDGEVFGYGKAAWMAPCAGGGRGAPDGWYLTGVVVRPDRRRCGVGTRLTIARLDRLGQVTDTVWYFASMRNQASIDLHHRLGFTFVTDDFVIPDVTFTGGRGGLFQRASDRTPVRR